LIDHNDNRQILFDPPKLMKLMTWNTSTQQYDKNREKTTATRWQWSRNAITSLSTTKKELVEERYEQFDRSIQTTNTATINEGSIDPHMKEEKTKKKRKKSKLHIEQFSCLDHKEYHQHWYCVYEEHKKEQEEKDKCWKRSKNVQLDAWFLLQNCCLMFYSTMRTHNLINCRGVQ